MGDSVDQTLLPVHGSTDFIVVSLLFLKSISERMKCKGRKQGVMLKEASM